MFFDNGKYDSTCRISNPWFILQKQADDYIGQQPGNLRVLVLSDGLCNKDECPIKGHDRVHRLGFEPRNCRFMRPLLNHWAIRVSRTILINVYLINKPALFTHADATLT